MPESGSSSQGNTPPQRPEPNDGARPKERKRVGFSESYGEGSSRNSVINEGTSGANVTVTSPVEISPSSPSHSRYPSTTGHLSPELEQELSSKIYEAFGQPYPAKPKPAIRKPGTISPNPLDFEDMSADQSQNAAKVKSGKRALERAQKLAIAVGNESASASRRNSIELDPLTRPPVPSIQLPDIQDDTESDDDDTIAPHQPLRRGSFHAEANNLVQAHTQAFPGHFDYQDDLRSGQVTPRAEQEDIEDYIPKPDKYKGGVLSTLLKLYPQSMGTALGGHADFPSRPTSMVGTFSGTSTMTNTPQHSPPESGTSTPKRGKHWYSRSTNPSTSSLGQLVGSSIGLASPVQQEFHKEVSERLKKERPGMGKRTRSGELLHRMNKAKADNAYKIKIHLAQVISRQRYLMKLCRALMEYGAPTHRLEEYMRMSARVLEIESQFLYVPGCMIISFDDSHTHTTEVKLVRAAHGVDLGKLRDTHEIYKEVVHDIIGVDEAMTKLDEVVKRKRKFSVWVLVPMYGLASVCVGPFAFQARLIDLPIAFVLGCIVGTLQLVIAPRSDIYANVFEIAAAIITSFLARLFGSINGGDLFCFSALAQSSIALILPGYTVLCASLELQSRSMIAGSVRMVYAIIYSLFLGFGITIGSVIYGLMDSNATSETQCRNSMDDFWYFWFVPPFTFCLIVINQAKWKQAPLMILIAFAGYVVNFFSARRFVGNAQVANTLGALAIGFLANLHSRLGQKVDNVTLDLWENRIRPIFQKFGCCLIRHRIRKASIGSDDPEKADFDPNHKHRRRVGYSLAAAAMLPAIFVQVPSGLAVNGSLVSGITSADQITGNATGTTTATSGSDAMSIDGVALNVGYSVIQVAIGITVGLFLSALFVYPLGKKRSGLFSF